MKNCALHINKHIYFKKINENDFEVLLYVQINLAIIIYINKWEYFVCVSLSEWFDMLLQDITYLKEFKFSNYKIK